MDRKGRRAAWAVLAALFLVQASCWSAREGDLDAPQPSMATATAAVDCGFVLLDGRYMPPPYIVTRQGLELFINGHRIQTETTRSAGSAPELVMERLDQVRATYERRLREADCYVVFSDGGEMWLASYGAAYQLPDLLSFLRSDAPLEAKLAELRRRGWGFAFSDDALRTLATQLEAPFELDGRLEKLGKQLLRVDEFGTSMSGPMDTGFAFLDGAYLDAPYTVAREGLAVFLNGHMIVRPERWPVPPPPPGDVDPEMPAGISRETSLYDDVLKDFLASKFQYAKSHYEPEEEKGFMERAIRSLACIKTAQLDQSVPTSLHVTSFRGESCSFGLVQLRRRPQTDRVSVQGRAEQAKSFLAKQLERGDCLFLRSTGGRLTMGAEKLPGIVAVLRSSEPVETKVQKLQQTLLAGHSEDTIRAIVVGFRASPQLEERLRILPHRSVPGVSG